MLWNHLKITIRYLIKNKLYSFINIAGLAIALLTVSWQSFTAATNNPVNSLREE